MEPAATEEDRGEDRGSIEEDGGSEMEDGGSIEEDSGSEMEDRESDTELTAAEVEFLELAERTLALLPPPVDREAKAVKLLDEKIGKIQVPLPLPLYKIRDILYVVDGAACSRKLKTGVDEVTIDVCDGESELLLMALDAQDVDSLAHLPLLALSKNVPYLFVPFTEILTAVSRVPKSKSQSVFSVTKGSGLGAFIHYLTHQIKYGNERGIEPPPKKAKLATPQQAGGRYLPLFTDEKVIKSLYDETKAKFDYVPVVVGYGDEVTECALLAVREATRIGQIIRGTDEVAKALCRDSSDLLVVMAADAEDLDSMLHLPLLAKAKKVPYVFIPSWKELTVECGLPESQPVTVCSIIGKIINVGVWIKDITGLLKYQMVQSEREKDVEPPLKNSKLDTQETVCLWCPRTFASENGLASHLMECKGRLDSCFAQEPLKIDSRT